MRRVLLVSAALTFAVACTDNITEPVPDRPDVTAGATRAGPMVAFATTTTEDGLSISTDKDDYAPGDTVHFTGSGWQPGEVLDVRLDDDPAMHPPHSWTITVGPDGAFHDSTYVVDTDDLGIIFTLTATSTTGRSVSVTFTDAAEGDVTQVIVTPVAVSGGFKLQVQVTGDVGKNQAWRTTAYQIQAAQPSNGNAFGTCIDKDPDVLGPTGSGTPPPATGTQSFEIPGPFAAGSSGTVWIRIRALACTSNNPNDGQWDETNGQFNIPSKLAFITPAFSRQVTVCSPQITVQTQNAASESANPVSNTTVNLSTNSGGGTFYSDAACSAGITSVGIPNTGNTASFFYKDTQVGSPTLTASATGLTSATQQETITAAPNAAPTVNAGDYTIAEGSELTLAPTVNDPDGDALTYKWTVLTTGIDAGGACTFVNDAVDDAKLSCTDDSQGAPSGKFTLTLEVNDGNGHVVTDNADLTVTNANPNASAGGPTTGYSVNEGSALQLDGLGDDPGTNDNPHLTYKWTVNTTGIDAGGACAFDDDEIEDPEITCTDDSNLGEFTLSLVVKDDDLGTSEAGTAVLRVNNVKPVANAGGGATGYSGEEGSAIQLAGSADDPGDNDDPHLTYQWTVNTAGIDASGTCTFDDATDKNAKVTCTDDSDDAVGDHFKLTLIASDDEGNASVQSYANLTVTNAGPVANAGPDYTGTEGAPVQLQGSVQDAGSSDTHTWYWKYVNGATVDAGATCSFSPNAQAEDPTITCTDDGAIELTLKVTDDDGGFDTDVATLNLTNAAPVAAAGGPYTGAEGIGVPLAGSANDPGDNDDPGLTYKWTVVTAGVIDAGGACSFDDDTKKDATVTCTDDSNVGKFTLSLVATDDDGGVSVASTADLTVTNANPIATAGGPYSGTEGQAIQLGGSGDDPGNNDDDPVLTYLWTSSAPSICTFDVATSKTAKVTCNDNGNFTLTLTANDDDGGTGTNTAALTVNNAPPVITTLTVSPTVVQVGAPVTLNATFTDQGTGDTHTASINWEGFTSSGTVTEANGSGSVTGTHSYSATGIYTVTLTVTDDDLASDTEAFPQYIVVYDPSAGFVTGGGWITSPAGAYRQDLYLTGKANFGFVSKYQKGANTPTGNTEFQFHAGSLNFSSSVYEWLVVQGQNKASYKGSGTVNGASGYGFLLSVIDNGSSGDRFRIKIWNKATGTTVYDNQYGADDEASAAQPIAGGSIVIHTSGGVASK